MSISSELISLLYDADLLPTPEIEFEYFLELERAIISHLDSNIRSIPAVIRFDTECIEGRNDYFHLLNEILAISGTTNEAKKIEISQTKIDEHYQYSICGTKGRSRTEESWMQDSDWVAPEFFKFVFSIATTRKGSIVELTTMDQTCCLVFMEGELIRCWKKEKKLFLASRKACNFLGKGVHNRFRFGQDIKLLPEEKFHVLMKQFRANFLTGDNITDERSYKENCALKAYVAESVGFNIIERHKYFKALEITDVRYVQVNSRYDYEVICPDEDCYILMFDQNTENALFDYKAKMVCHFIGEIDVEVNSYLILGKNIDWAILAGPDYFISVGAKALELFTPLVVQSVEDKYAKYYDFFVQSDYRERLRKLGYVYEHTDALGNTRFKIEIDDERSFTLQIRPDREELEGPLFFGVRIFGSNKEIDLILGCDKPNSFLCNDLAPTLKTIWLYDLEAGFEQFSSEFYESIEAITRRLRSKIEGDDLIRAYQATHSPIHAAVVAKQTGNLAFSKKIVDDFCSKAEWVTPSMKSMIEKLNAYQP